MSDTTAVDNGAGRGKRRLAAALAVALTFHTLLAYGFPPAFPLGMTLLLGLLYRRIGAANALLVAVSFAVATGALEGALRLSGVERTMYARPGNLLDAFDYRHDHKAYRPGAQVEMEIAQGDLQSLTAADLREPHRSLFRTDAFGFRNDRDYHGQRLVLVGDSFVAGVNNSQEQTLANQLLRDHGIDAYAAAHPGDVDDYRRYVNGLRERIGPGFKVLLFLFEGNDFPTAGEGAMGEEREVDARLHGGYKRYFGLFSSSLLYRYTYVLYKRFRLRDEIGKGSEVLTAELAGRPLAFYRPYVAAAAAADYRPPPGWEEGIAALGENLGRIYFVPTKYRVYRPLTEPQAAPLPAARRDYLWAACARRGWACSDLTPALQEGARRLAEERPARLLYWRDDTHWNGAGIAVAAQVVAAELATDPATEAAAGAGR